MGEVHATHYMEGLFILCVVFYFLVSATMAYTLSMFFTWLALYLMDLPEPLSGAISVFRESGAPVALARPYFHNAQRIKAEA